MPIEHLKSARNAYNFLLATCGIYFLSGFAFQFPDAGPGTVSVVGFKMPDQIHYAVFASMVIMLTLFRWYVYLEQLQLHENYMNSLAALRDVGWTLAALRGGAAEVMKWLEFILIAVVVWDIGIVLSSIASNMRNIFLGVTGLFLLGCYVRVWRLLKHLKDA